MNKKHTKGLLNNDTGENIEYEAKESKKNAKVRRSVFLIITVILLSCAVYVYVSKYIPNFEHIPFYEYYEGIDENTIYIVFHDKLVLMENYPIRRNGEIYIPAGFVKQYVDSYIFWDSTVGRLTITNENKVIRIRAGELNYYVNNDLLMLPLPVYNINDEAYMPSTMLTELYNLDISFREAYNMLIIDYKGRESQTSLIIKEKGTEFRYLPDIKSPIQYSLEFGEVLFVYGQQGEFTKARSSEGLIGYVKTPTLGQISTIPPVQIEITRLPLKKPFSEKINIVWDQVTTIEANSSESRRIAHEGLDVLSPTWFSFDMEKLNGDIISLADKNYVDWAHENNFQVWALITDNFDFNVSNAILSNTEIREYVIQQLITFVKDYNLDGINIDFEMVRAADAGYYIQFLRELAPFLREQGAYLSVDMYVPTKENLYYNRTEVGKTADFVIIMGYDEHWATSPVSGPVASISFVENGIRDTLLEVPKEKVILGLPYYVRVWTEKHNTDGAVEVRSNAYSMEYAYNMFIENGASFEWDDVTFNYYAEYEALENDEVVLKRVWLEDERSIEEKLKLVVKYDLEGVAGWKRNLELEAIWALIKSYIKN